MHDARLGRFLSVDPLFHKFIFNSPYGFASNSPVSLADILGLAPGDPNTALTKGGPTQFLKDNGISSSSLAGWIPLLDNLAAANPDKFSDYEFSAVDSKKWNYWNSLANNKARWDKGMKFNVPKGNEEIGPAMARIKEFESLMTTSVFPSVTKKKFVSDLRARVSTGGEQIQQSQNTCGLAACVKLFADINPLGYSNFAIDLYTTGAAKIGSIRTLAEGIIPWAQKLKSSYWNGVGTCAGADLVVIASLRKTYNMGGYEPGDDDYGIGMGGGLTLPDEVTEFLKAFTEKTVSMDYSLFSNSGIFNAMLDESNVIKAKNVYSIILRKTDTDLFSPWHYQVFKGDLNEIKDKHYSYSCWDYGKSKHSTADLKNLLRGLWLVK